MPKSSLPRSSSVRPAKPARPAPAVPLSRSRWAGVPAAERQAERRVQLVEAAFDLLGTEGDAATTVRAVCQRARLNPRYFYESFADRDELLVAAYDHVVSLLAGEAADALMAAGDEPAAVTRAGITTVVRFVTDDPRRARLLYSEALGNEALNRRRLETSHNLVDFLVGWTEERHGRPPEGEQISSVAASMLVGGLGELLLAWLEGRIPITQEQLIDDAVALFLATGEAAAKIAQNRPRSAPPGGQPPIATATVLPMGDLKVDIDAAEAGFDAGRLARIDRHFAGYVDDGRLPGWLLAVTRGGSVVHLAAYGHRDVEADLPVELDTVFRIYSMTKPVTSVAAMMLAEEGAFELKDPVNRFLPSFAEQRVYRSGSALRPETDPVVEPMRIWHLLTHTAGLTYGFHHSHPVDAMYRAAGFEWGSPEGLDTAGCCDAWAAMPLVFQPGSEWNYGVSTDVLGRVVEVASGQRLDEFIAERITGPLGMTDTAFTIAAEDRHRLAALYVPDPASGQRLRFDALGAVTEAAPPFLSGGGGLVSTAADYLRFCEMLRRGGELDGTRLLGTRTVRYMTRNHLPGGADLEAFGRPLFSETTFDGVGFGLGFAVVDDPVKNKVPGSVGEFLWGGAASTAFWVDPEEDITVVFLTQLLPSSTHPIRSQLKALVHQALVD